TSIFPERRVTPAPIPPPPRNGSPRPPLLAPRTSWGAFSTPAQSRRAGGAASPTTRGPPPPPDSATRPPPPPPPGGGAGGPAPPHHVQGEQVGSRRARGDPDRAAQQGLPLGTAREGHDDALARLPRLVDPVVGAVALETLVDPFGHPQQGQLAERAEVADPE